jgi:hypothetical protein
VTGKSKNQAEEMLKLADQEADDELGRAVAAQEKEKKEKAKEADDDKEEVRELYN